MDQCWRTASMMKQSVVWLRICFNSIVLGLGALVVLFGAAYAQEIPPDAACIDCHVDNDEIITLSSGEIITADVDLEVLVASVHNFHEDLAAETAVFCTDCHDPADYVYPHRPLPVDTLDEFGEMVSENCQLCHFSIEEHNPGHLIPEIYDLNENLPTCSDCHGGHAVAPADLLGDDPVEFCLSCHQTFEDQEMGRLHEQFMANLSPLQNCQTCHTDEVASSVNAPSFATADQCVTCHSLLESEMVLPSDETVSLHVTGEEVLNSVHGERLAGVPGYRPLICVDCHDLPGYQIFPHDLEIAQNRREYTFDRSGVCQKCHSDVFADERDGIHAHALAEGDLNAATCVDCHGAHDIQPPDEPRQRIALTCGNCHSTIFEQYEDSVHGAALLARSNPDVPTCVDCHGVHGIPDPNTALFRLRSPQICAECHADDAMMAKYDISTDVFDTYVDDFHGTTVAIFEQTAPDQVPTEAVCYDCHGVHNILPVTDENSQVLKANLLVTCQQCHPDATENFPDAWMSHFRPSLDHYPLVYLVDLFYAIFIPLVLGGFLVFVVGDASRRLLNRRQRNREFPS
jgi:predicted CXXCH cytochrome family protein